MPPSLTMSATVGSGLSVLLFLATQHLARIRRPLPYSRRPLPSHTGSSMPFHLWHHCKPVDVDCRSTHYLHGHTATKEKRMDTVLSLLRKERWIETSLVRFVVCCSPNATIPMRMLMSTANPTNRLSFFSGCSQELSSTTTLPNSPPPKHFISLYNQDSLSGLARTACKNLPMVSNRAIKELTIRSDP